MKAVGFTTSGFKSARYVQENILETLIPIKEATDLGRAALRLVIERNKTEKARAVF